MNRKHAFTANISIAALCFQANLVVAQQQKPIDSANTGLEEIVVTATRREESIEKVPISIQALSQSEMTAAGIKGIADLAAVTPGLQFSSPAVPATEANISIRGMNTNTGSSTVGIYIDDTPVQGRISAVGLVGNPFPVVFDLNRVEVERGPQGTLFGAGSEAGTVRFITNQPSLTEFSGFAHAESAITQDGGPSYEIGAAAGGPIVDDKLGFRVSVWHREDGGYVDRIAASGLITARNVNTDEKQAIRAALALQVNDAVRVTPSFLYQSIRADDDGRFNPIFSDPSDGHFNDGALRSDASTDKFNLSSVKVEADLFFGELVSTTSYFDRKVNGQFDLSTLVGEIGLANYGNPLGPGFPTSPSDVAPSPFGQTIRGFTEEVRLASKQPGAFFTWVSGVFYDHRNQVDSQYAYSLMVDPTGAPIYYTRQGYIDEQLAVFAQGDFHITDKWTATLGGREAKVKSVLSVNNGTGAFNAGEPAVASSTSKVNPFTPKVALSYQADPNDLFYVSAGKGFRVGGGNAPLATFCGVTAPSAYGPDYVWSYELGAKNKLFGGKVQIDSSVYHVDWSNMQQLVYPPCGLNYIFNGGKAVSNGFDIATQALVTDRLRLDFDIGYTNAYFTQNVYTSGTLVIQSGNKIGFLPQVNPPWDVNTAVNYTIPLSQDNKIHLRGEYQYHSRNPGPFMTQIPTSPIYYPLNVADPPTHLFNARLGTTFNKLDVTLFVDNAFNSHPLLDQFRFTSTSNWVTNSTFRPRTVGLSANYGF